MQERFVCGKMDPCSGRKGMDTNEREKDTHKPFGKREIKQLRNNPYIVSVTSKTVCFTEEFEQMVYDGKLLGVSVSETMRRCGIDPEILAANRVEGFRYTLNKKAKQGRLSLHQQCLYPEAS